MYNTGVNQAVMSRFAQVILVLLLCCGAVTAFKQNEFVISFWVDPVVPPAQFVQEYTRIAAANFTTLMGGFGATTPSGVAAQLAACAAVGLSALPNSCESPSGPGPEGTCVNLTSSSLMGFQVCVCILMTHTLFVQYTQCV